MLFHGKRKNKTSFLICESCENCCNTYRYSFLFHFNDRKELHSAACFSKIKLHFYFTGWKLWTFMKRHKQGQAFSLQHSKFQPPFSSHMNFSHKRSYKPAFSTLKRFLSEKFKVHLFVNDWSCAGKTVNSEVDFSTATRKSKVQHHRQAACRTLFCLSVGLQAPMTCSIFRSG